jgi:hypothetical protein
MNFALKFLGFLLIAAIITAAGIVYFSRPGAETGEMQTPADSESEVEVRVSKTDITQNGVSKLPSGFPKDIPVEVANITESYRATYSEKGITQYTVSYTSQESRDSLWDLYNNYLKTAGYTVDTRASSKSQGQITGVKNNDTLSTVISSRGNVTFVQINLLDR